MYDIVIIGRGPAGISAALYAVRANLSVAVIGKDMGSLAKAGKIENYYGLDVPLSGAELARRGVLQAMRLGASMPEGEVLDAEFDSGIFRVRTKAESYEGRALILATGSSRKRNTSPLPGDTSTPTRTIGKPSAKSYAPP